MSKKLTIDQFITRANIIHNNRYDYSKVIYLGAHKKVIIGCKIHGDFLQTPDGHINSKRGCIQCGVNQQKQTCFTNHGVYTPFESSNIQNKSKQTWRTKYGVDNPMKSGIIKNRYIQNYTKTTGFAWPLLSSKIQNKSKQTWRTKYGVDNPMKSQEILQKRVIKVLNTYGVSHYNKKHMVEILPLVQNFDWLYDQYVTLNKTATQIAQELGIVCSTVCNSLHYHEITIRQLVKFSWSATQWLESIIHQEGIFIQHAGNIGEYKISGTRYLVDGYCQETNTCYEFHGDIWHGNPTTTNPDERCNPYSDLTASELYQKTIERENHIKTLGYNLVVMWESEYNKILKLGQI